MSAPRRHQLRDHLGRFTRSTDRPGRLRPVAERVRRGGRLLRAALRDELARRLYRLAVVAVALAGAVVLLYEHSDSPATLARTAQVASAAPAPKPTRAAPERAGGPGGPAGGTGTRAPTKPDRPGSGEAKPIQPVRPTAPAVVAAAWYAARNHLRAGQVRPLQQDKVSHREVRVLVMADRGNGRLDTALVPVRRDARGRWSVP